MEKFVLRENGFHGYAQSQPKSPNGNSEDMDFNDVFGGPPRRFSIQDVKLRYSFGDAAESDEEIVSSALNQKPIFGDDGVPRRRHHQGDDFFDDIFRGEESYYSPRRTSDRDSAYGSSSSSRILSPAKPLPPLGTSVPAQFSLPAKLTKGLEIPTFAVNGQNKMDASTNGLNSAQSSIPLSRFLSHVIQGQDDIPVYRQSPLSRGVSLSGDDTLPTLLTSDHKENVDNKEKDRGYVDGLGNQFHFSIYKWAGREVPMMLPLVGGDKTKTRDGYHRSASSKNERIENKLPARVGKTRGFSAAGSEAVKVETMKGGFSSKERVKDQTVVSGGERQNTKERGKSMDDIDVQVKAEREVPLRKGESGRYANIDVQEKSGKKVPVKKKDSLRFEIKALRTFLRDEVGSPKTTEEKPLQSFLDSGMESPGNTADRKGNKKRIPNGIHSSPHDSKTSNGKEPVRAPSYNGVLDGANLQDEVTVDSGTSHGETGVKGKVREFVQIFNQDADSKPKSNLQRRSKSSRWKAVDADQKENGMSTNTAEVKEMFNVHNVAKKPDVSVKVDENLNKDEAQQNSPMKATSDTTQRSSTSETEKNGFASEKFHRDSMVNFEDLLEDEFLVQELPEDHGTIAKSEDFDETKAIDAKIRQWSYGKKGNIRSLLSTLQFVLWPESGWKPVPLADLIEMNAVKRAYQKALLRLHPDKLQQKGAAFHQKYTAEKVFDILQEAWDEFNTLVPL